MSEQRRHARAQQVRTALRVLGPAQFLSAAPPHRRRLSRPSPSCRLDSRSEAFRGRRPTSRGCCRRPISWDATSRRGVERFVAVWGPGGGAALFLHNGEVSLAWPPSDAAAPRRGAAGGAAGSRMQTAGPLTVFLSEPRTDYRHGALGGGVEAGRVIISEASRSAASDECPGRPDKIASVERRGGRGLRGPRAAPGRPRRRRDARDPRGQVLSRQGLGARGGRPSRGRWTILAETPPTASRSLAHPAAVADFSGDGKPASRSSARPTSRACCNCGASTPAN